MNAETTRRGSLGVALGTMISLSGCGSIASVTLDRRDVALHVLNATSEKYEVEVQIPNSDGAPIAETFLMYPETVQVFHDELSPATYEIRVIVPDSDSERRSEWEVSEYDCSRDAYVSLYPGTDGVRLQLNPGICGSE